MKDKLDKEIATTLQYIREVDETIKNHVIALNGYYEGSLEAVKQLDQLGKIRDEYENCLQTLIKLRCELDSDSNKD